MLNVMTVEKAYASVDAKKRSAERIKQAVVNYYTKERLQTGVSNTDPKAARLSAVEQCFLAEIEELVTDPDYKAGELELIQAKTLLAGKPIMQREVIWADLLSYITQSFRISQSGELVRKFFTCLDNGTST